MRQKLVLLVLASVFAVTLNAQRNETIINNDKFIFTSNVVVKDTLVAVVKSVSKFTLTQENTNIDLFSRFVNLQPIVYEGIAEQNNIYDVAVSYVSDEKLIVNDEASATNGTQYVFVPIKTPEGQERVEFSFISYGQVKYIDVDLKGFLKKVVDTAFGKVEVRLFGQHYTATHIETGKVLFDYRSDVVLNVR